MIKEDTMDFIIRGAKNFCNKFLELQKILGRLISSERNGGTINNRPSREEVRKMSTRRLYDMKSKLAFVSFWVFFAFLLLFLVCSDSALASTVGTSTTSYATSLALQRKSFYANGRFWVFYSDGIDLKFKSSTDGNTWDEDYATPDPFEAVQDFYSEANYQDSLMLASLDPSASGEASRRAQSFTAPSKFKLSSVKFYLHKYGSPTGTAYAKLFSIASGDTPSTTVLATSDGFDVSTLTTSLQLITFTFSGAQQYECVSGTKYAIAFVNPSSGTITTSHYVKAGVDTSSPTHAGAESYFANGAWTTSSNDLVFYVYGLPYRVRPCTAGYRFSIWFDGTYVHYAYSDDTTSNTPVYYRRGTPNSDGTITWSAAEQIAKAAESGVFFKTFSIAVDSSGYPYIAYVASQTPYVTKSSTNDGTWATATNFPYQLYNSASNYWAASIVPLTSLKVYVIYQNQPAGSGFGNAYGKLWNGTAWGSQEDASTSTPYYGPYFSAVANGDDVHFVFLKKTSYDIVYRKRTYGTGPGSWGTEATVRSATTSTSAPVLSIDTATGNLYCFWAGSPTANHIYYKKNVSGTWDTDPTDWINESTDTLTDNDRLTAYYKDYGSTMGLVYMAKGLSPYDVRIAGMKPTAVGLESFRARQYEDKVLLEWRSGYEVNNLGFNLYREEGGQRTQINSELVKGSALLTGAGTITAGHSYAWLDTPVPSTHSSKLSPQSSSLATVKYWLEDVDLNGKRTMHGPVTPEFSDEPLPKKGQAALLSQLAMSQSEEDKIVSRIEALQGRLSKKVAISEGVREVSPMELDQSVQVGKKLTPLEVQWALAERPAVKLFIQEEGWYRVTQPDLVAAGLDKWVDPRFLQLFVDGEEMPIVVTGEKDGRFDPQDAIEFYGLGLDTPSTETRVYWLVVGSKPGKRVQQVVKGLKGQAGSASFPLTVERKPRTIYFAALRNGDADNFFGPLVSITPLDQILRVQHLDQAPPGEALLEVALQGVTAGPHKVKIILNGVEVGAMTLEGEGHGLAKISFSQAVLREGENKVRLVAQGGDSDLSLIDFIRLTYWHTYTADEDALRFTAVGGKQLLIEGFSSSQIRVMDITNPKKVQEVMGVVKSKGAGFAIWFNVPGYGQHTLLAFTDERVERPAAIEANQPSKWHQAGRAADLVIIAHGDFLESLRPLKALRKKQGWSVALTDVEDLYDEFSFGNKTPQAIRDFLLRAKSYWQKSPRFVLLAGDASFDPRNYLGLGNFDFVPTKVVDTMYLETASDDWFVDFNGDGLPEMAVGRLPVRFIDEASTVISKIIGYEQGSGGWTREVLLVADINDSFDFEAASSGVEALLPDNLTVKRIFRGQFEDDERVRKELLGDLNQGALLVNYLGHGSTEVWRGYVFTSEDAEGLVNGPRLPFVVSMTCLNGLFHDLYSESLAEALLKAKNGGAVAVWTSSGMTEPGGQTVMDKELFRLLFNGESLTLGEATMRAKKAVGDGDIRRTWILFGDPTTRLKY
jgi:hypothetical protein